MKAKFKILFAFVVLSLVMTTNVFVAGGIYFNIFDIDDIAYDEVEICKVLFEHWEVS